MQQVSVRERRQGTRDTINKLMEERRQMLVLFCRVAGLEPFSAKAPTLELLEEFCEVLIDYSAFGHFEIYERIASGRERRQRVIEVAEQVYPRIAEASEAAVEFNDRYDADNSGTADLSRLSTDLSRLGEELAVRIEMEDQIVAALLAR